MIRFYSKQSPRQKFYTPDGHWLAFDQIDDQIGVAAITDEAQQKDIAIATAANRGGITEITQEEYQALQGKKKEPSKKWREEISLKSMGETHSSARLPQNDPVEAVVAAGKDRSEKVAKVAEAAKPSAKKKAK